MVRKDTMFQNVRDQAIEERAKIKEEEVIIDTTTDRITEDKNLKEIDQAQSQPVYAQETIRSRNSIHFLKQHFGNYKTSFCKRCVEGNNIFGYSRICSHIFS